MVTYSKRKLLFIGFIIINSIGLMAQSNIEKYWYYRHRLVNGFVKIGNQPGESLIAGVRNLYQDSNPAGNNIHDHKYLDYGDQTIYLGWYIGVLATEYKLLKDAGKSTENTKTELYYAIEALYRL